MKDRRVLTVIIIALLLFCVIIIGVLLSMFGIDKQTKDTTALYFATIKDIHIGGTMENTYVEIFTNEYGSALRVSTNIAGKIDIDSVKELNKGQTIFFRIENIKVEQLNQVEFLDIVSLSTNTEEIYNLDQYNEYMHNAAYPARMTGVVMVIVLIVAALCCHIVIRKERDTRDKGTVLISLEKKEQ